MTNEEKMRAAFDSAKAPYQLDPNLTFSYFMCWQEAWQASRLDALDEAAKEATLLCSYDDVNYSPKSRPWHDGYATALEDFCNQSIRALKGETA